MKTHLLMAKNGVNCGCLFLGVPILFKTQFDDESANNLDVKYNIGIVDTENWHWIIQVVENGTWIFFNRTNGLDKKYFNDLGEL